MTPESLSGPPSAATWSAARTASQAAANVAANKPDDKDIQSLAEDLRENAPPVVPPSLPGMGAKVDVYAGEGPMPKAAAPPEPKADEEDPPYDPLGARWERIMEAPELPYLKPLQDGKGGHFDSTL